MTSDASFMFGDYLLVVKLTVMPASKLQCLSHILKYHCTKEAQVKGIIKFVHIDTNDNPGEKFTKSRASNTWFPLMNPLLFWLDVEFLQEQVVVKGSANRSSTPPLYQGKGTTHQSFNIDLRYILGD